VTEHQDDVVHQTDHLLTDLQHRVMTALCQGMTYRTASRLLGIGKGNSRAVGHHMQQAVRKMGVDGSWAAMARYSRYLTLLELATELELMVDGLEDLAADNAQELANQWREQAHKLVPPTATPQCDHGRMLLLERCDECEINRTQRHPSKTVKFQKPGTHRLCIRCTVCGTAPSSHSHEVKNR